MDALKVRHKMTSHFAAISPQVDINALVMDLTVKAPQVTCRLSAINIAGYVYAHCDFDEAAFTAKGIFEQIVSKVDVMLCVISTARYSPLSAELTPQVQQITAETLFSSDRPDPFQCTRAHTPTRTCTH